MKNRLFSLLLCFALCFSLTACQPQEPVPAKELSFGVYENGVYTNAYFGIACVLGHDWEVMSSSEQQQIHDLLTDTAISDTIGDVGAYEPIPDLKASRNTGFASIDINYIKAAPDDTAEALSNPLLNEDYTTLIGATMEQLGMENTSMNSDLVTFCGESEFTLSVSGTIAGIPIYEIMLLHYNDGDEYMAQIVTMATTKAEAVKLFQQFCPIDAIPDDAWDTTPEAADVPVAADPPYGSLANDIYTNSYAGLSIDFSAYSGWTCTLGEKVDEQQMDDGASCIAMSAQNDALCAITIHFQKFPEDGLRIYRGVTREQAVDLMLSTKDDLVQVYAEGGMEVTAMEKRFVICADDRWPAVYTCGTIMGMEYHSLQLIDYTLGDYSISIEAMSIGSDQTAALLEMFRPLG